MPRAGINRRKVVAEAAEVVDAVGPDRLTLAAVAKRLGVSLPSLYKHIGGLDELQRDLAVLAVDELRAAISAAAVGRSGREALRAVAIAYRDYAKRHPGRYALSVRAPADTDAEHVAASDAIVAVAAAALSAYRISGVNLVDAIRTLRAALHGFVSLEHAGGFGLPMSVDDTFTRLVDALDTVFQSWGPSRERPPTNAA